MGEQPKFYLSMDGYKSCIEPIYAKEYIRKVTNPFEKENIMISYVVELKNGKVLIVKSDGLPKVFEGFINFYKNKNTYELFLAENVSNVIRYYPEILPVEAQKGFEIK